MPNPYFSNLGDFLYVNRTEDGRKESDFSLVKNFFKRPKLREDIFQDLTFFTKYTILGDDRPDNVAHDVYGDATLDWVVLMSNNIINVQSEWPLSQADFNTYVLNKYDEETLYSGIHHYKSREVKTLDGTIIIPSGVRVGVGQSVSFFDDLSQQQVIRTDVASPVTNYMHETEVNEKKRDIFLLKPIYLNIILDDLEEFIQFDYEDAILELPREIVLMLTTMDNAVLGVDYIQVLASKINTDSSLGAGTTNLMGWWKLNNGSITDSGPTGGSYVTYNGDLESTAPTQDYDAFSVNVQDNGTTPDGAFTITQGKVESLALT